MIGSVLPAKESRRGLREPGTREGCFHGMDSLAVPIGPGTRGESTCESRSKTVIERQKIGERRATGKAVSSKRRARSSGLQARMRALYIKITLGVIMLVLCLYAAFLVGTINYILPLKSSTL